MANNRMFLRCSTCGAEFMLAKTLDNVDWYFKLSNEDQGSKLAEFLDKHGLCEEEQHPLLADRKHPFELVYEEDEDYRIYDYKQLTPEYGFRRAYNDFNGDRKIIAKMLGLSVRTVDQKCKEYGLQ